MIDIQLKGIRSELNEIKNDVRSQSKSMQDFLVRMTKQEYENKKY